MANRPLMSAVAAQQKVLADLKHENEVLRLQLAYVARLAGVSEPLEAIRRLADERNPAQPVPDPADQAPTETTEETLNPEANDNANRPGQTPGANANVPAKATGTPMDAGTTLPTNPYNNLVDVTAPVTDTKDHINNEQTRIETDVRVGDPMNPETAFPLNPAFGDTGLQAPAGPPKDGEMHQTGSRTMASLRLAKLRIQAGLAKGDEFEVTASIEADKSLTNQMIENEIKTLSAVAKVSARQARPQNLVPKAAAHAPRVSLQSTATAQVPVAGNNDDAEDIFL